MPQWVTELKYCTPCTLLHMLCRMSVGFKNRRRDERSFKCHRKGNVQKRYLNVTNAALCLCVGIISREHVCVVCVRQQESCSRAGALLGDCGLWFTG